MLAITGYTDEFNGFAPLPSSRGVILCLSPAEEAPTAVDLAELAYCMRTFDRLELCHRGKLHPTWAGLLADDRVTLVERT